MLPTKAVVGFLVTLAFAEAAKLSKDSLYHVVEDLPANETVEASEQNVATCFDIMARNGLNFSSFWHGAALGLHSLHLEEIWHFFEPNASENNKIPVVNKNFSSKQTILFDAPLAGYDEHFNTMALKVMSYFMLNDHPDFFQQGVNTLEKLTHQYHMHEIYAAAAPIYNAMKENPPSDPELCACVNDITGNGILIEMANIARQLKYFESKRRPRAKAPLRINLGYGGGCAYWSINIYVCRKKRAAENTESDEAKIADLEQEYLTNPTHETAFSLLDARPWKTNTLVGPEQWISYQAMLTASMLEEEELNDFATFMYCRLNQPDTDHPKELFD
jgi:hypothetical protein